MRRAALAPFAAFLLIASPALAAPLSIGVLGPNQKVRPQDNPTTSPAAALKAGRNEFEPFQIVLFSAGGSAGVKAHLSGSLTGPAGAAIPDANVVMYAAGYYELSAPSNSEGAAGRWPIPLVPDTDTYVGEKRSAFPFDVPAGESRVVWVDVLVPADAAPGDYQGEISVEDAAGSAGTIPISLHVGAFTLPSTASLASAFGMGWSDPCKAHTGSAGCDPQTGWDEPKADALRALYVRSALEHRFTISLLDFQPPFGGSQPLFEQSLLPLADGTAETRLAGARVTSVDIDSVDGTDLDKWIPYAKQKNFFDRLFYYPIDEPGADAGKWATFVAQAAKLHGVDPAARIIITSSIEDADAAMATDSVDIFVPVIDQLENRPGTAYEGDHRPKYDPWLAAKPGRKIWGYQSCDSHGCGGCGATTTDPSFTGWPNRVIDSSAVQDRAFPWLAFRHALSGELYFDTSYQLTTAWDKDGQCAFGGSGDGTLFYPGKPAVIGGATDIPVESIRMKLIREGMEDYEYLTLVAAKDPALAHSIADALFPHAYECAQPPAALEAARDQLFALLDSPGGSGGAGGAGGASSGGGGTGAGGGNGGGAAGGGAAGKGSGGGGAGAGGMTGAAGKGGPGGAAGKGGPGGAAGASAKGGAGGTAGKAPGMTAGTGGASGAAAGAPWAAGAGGLLLDQGTGSPDSSQPPGGCGCRVAERGRGGAGALGAWLALGLVRSRRRGRGETAAARR